MNRNELVQVAITALASDDIEVRDAAVCLLERFVDSKQAMAALASYSDPANPWLTEYAHRVAAGVAL